ncbi:uncharacterized protein [Clytia hemisphaerica]|uniref:Uncharacterized protein n=1 Tax=Clytia hemisphaerica TaxID=252671 RepID=A0A7M5UY12_9CNID
MGIATRGYTYTIVFFGAVSLLLGMGAIICSGLLSNMVADVRITEKHSASAIFSVSSVLVLQKYWWLTFYYLLPSAVAFAVGCYSKTSLVLLYCILTLISLIGSMVGTILFPILLAVWNLTKTNLDQNCSDVYDDINKFESCACNETVAYNAMTFEHIHCEDLVGLKDILVGLVTVVVLQMVLNLVSFFVSCFAIAHQQKDNGTSETLTFATKPFGRYGGVFRGQSQYDDL